MCDDLKGRCANCERLWPELELDEIRDFWSRVSVGDLIPLGQCPKCSALCHVEREPETIIVGLQYGKVTDVKGIPCGVVVEIREVPPNGDVRQASPSASADGRLASQWGADVGP